jgi:hypothetical protein
MKYAYLALWPMRAAQLAKRFDEIKQRLIA